MPPNRESNASNVPSAGIVRRFIATGIDLLAWFTIAWFTWTADIPIILGNTSKWKALAELAGIHLLMPVCLSLELFTGATIGKWAVGLAVRARNGGRANWSFRLLRWFLKSSPWLLMVIDQSLVIVFEREVAPVIFQRMTDQLGRVGNWCMGLLDHVPMSDRCSQWLMLPLVSFSQLGIGVLLLLPLVAGELLVFLPSRRTLVERLTGTRILRRRHSTLAGPAFEVVVGDHRKSK